MICIKQLPNAITGLRIILSLILLFLTWHPAAFVIVYLCCGISDIADGFLARHLKIETKLGAMLDSLADFIFFGVNLYVLFTLIHVENEMLMLTIIAVIAIMRVANLVVTKRKFKKWCVMHTVANKAAGVLLFIFIPVCIWMESVPLPLITIVGIIAALSAAEEFIILITAKNYNENRKSLFQADIL